ncbi:MAG: fumarylacetoacetate hydrolase family protein [Burkholderiaceae bacterium]|jgi:2-keto-4-pentenoate hydratase/2-oxohepta-3-ene-1,7-dioic acid hydratase in catechol pathway|nr:fumarylacetoacetate hydrolase family protein [Burkholderiaceae bacterium]
MKLISFEINGADSYGVLADQGVIDLRRALADAPNDLKALLARADWIAAVRAVAAQAPHHRLDAVTLLPVIPNPGKIWCCGLNYGGHVREAGRTVSDKPTFFLRVADSQVAHGQPIMRPRESERLDYEGEIAVVIGKPGRRITPAEAWSHIAGYACYNDGSIRDWQKHGAQWDPGKNFWRTGGFGPWLLSADEITAGQVMTLTTRLNGQVMQQATTEQMLHSIPEQIAYLSTIAPLSPGDVIVTGTPEGVGAVRQPPVWMKPGDTVEVEIDAVGILRNTIAED